MGLEDTSTRSIEASYFRVPREVWICSELNVAAVERFVSRVVPVHRLLPFYDAAEESTEGTVGRILLNSTQRSKIDYVMAGTGCHLWKAKAGNLTSSKIIDVGSRRLSKRVKADLLTVFAQRFEDSHGCQEDRP